MKDILKKISLLKSILNMLLFIVVGELMEGGDRSLRLPPTRTLLTRVRIW